MTPLRWLLLAALAVLIPVGCYFSGSSCEDARGPTACREQAR